MMDLAIYRASSVIIIRVKHISVEYLRVSQKDAKDVRNYVETPALRYPIVSGNLFAITSIQRRDRALLSLLSNQSFNRRD